MSTLRALLHVPTMLFAVGVVLLARWIKRNGWIVSLLKAGMAASVLAAIALLA